MLPAGSMRRGVRLLVRSTNLGRHLLPTIAAALVLHGSPVRGRMQPPMLQRAGRGGVATVPTIKRRQRRCATTRKRGVLAPVTMICPRGLDIDSHGETGQITHGAVTRIYLIERMTHREARREAARRLLKQNDWRWLPMTEGYHRWRVLMAHRGRVTVLGRLTPNELADRR